MDLEIGDTKLSWVEPWLPFNCLHYFDCQYTKVHISNMKKQFKSAEIFECHSTNYGVYFLVLRIAYTTLDRK